MNRGLVVIAIAMLLVALLPVASWGQSGDTTSEKQPSAEPGTWQATSLVNAPSGRYDHTAVWTGNQMIVWGGYYAVNHFLNDGRKYDPASDTWTLISTLNAPPGRLRHSAIWTGQKMIVWGGESGGSGITTNTGGIYNAAADTWTAISTQDAPAAREQHTAVWTGQEMIVWGGCATVSCTTVFANGARYNLATDHWTAIAPAPAWLGPRSFHQAVWTGSRMLVWGGGTSSQGGAYDPLADVWTPISTVNAPTPTFQGASVWSGEEMIVWGGCLTYTTGNCPSHVGNGGRYNPVSDTWTPITAASAPSARYDHTAVWTGQQMIVWGGCASGCFTNGGAYDPVSDAWSAVSTVNAPMPRGNHRAVWTGQEMIVWGGCGSVNCSSSDYLSTGGRYMPELPGPGSITGRVWNDLDGDGKRDGGEPGLVGVAVKVFAGGIQIGQSPTAGDGSYAFIDLTPGYYVVREAHPIWLRFSSTPDEVLVAVIHDQTSYVDFGDWAGLSTWLPLVTGP